MMSEASAGVVSSLKAPAGDTPFDSLGEAMRAGGDRRARSVDRTPHGRG